MISFRVNSVYFQVNSHSIPIEFDSTKIESNSTRVEFDSIAPKQGFLCLRLDFCFLILTDRKNTNKIYIVFYIVRFTNLNKIKIIIDYIPDPYGFDK